MRTTKNYRAGAEEGFDVVRNVSKALPDQRCDTRLTTEVNTGTALLAARSLHLR